MLARSVAITNQLDLKQGSWWLSSSRRRSPIPEPSGTLSPNWHRNPKRRALYSPYARSEITSRTSPWRFRTNSTFRVLMAAAPFLSAATLAPALGVAMESAAALLDDFRPGDCHRRQVPVEAPAARPRRAGATARVGGATSSARCGARTRRCCTKSRSRHPGPGAAFVDAC